MKKMRQTNNVLARRLTHTFRFIDDLLAINDHGEFGSHFKEIYPEELELKRENNDFKTCSFLDIQIKIENNVFVTSLYDKRDDYNFKIVRLPYRISNIPKRMFFSSIMAEILRIARVTSSYDSFHIITSTLVKRMVSQGANLNEIKSSAKIAVQKHWHDFEKYNFQLRNLVSSIITM